MAQQVVAAAKGLTSGGVAPSPKHFPGHGDTHVDSHLALPVINKSLSALEQIELVPFKALAFCSDPAASIMTAHIALPSITGTDVPCTLSRQISTDLLRAPAPDGLGYPGVLVTDCLEMDAIANLPGGIEEGAVKALVAGADIAMICHTYERQVAAIELAWKAVESGRWSLEDLEKSSARIKKMKDTFARPSPPFDNEDWKKTKAEHEKLSMRAYERAICVLSDPANNFPLPSDSTGISLWTPEPESINKAVDDAEGVERSADEEGILRSKTGAVRNTASASFHALHSSVQSRVGVGRVQHVVYHQDGTSTTLTTETNTSQILMFVLRNADRSTWQLDQLKSQLTTGKYQNVVVLSSSTPYDLIGQDFGSASNNIAHVASYEYTPAAFEATARVLFGEVKPTGKCPVNLG